MLIPIVGGLWAVTMLIELWRIDNGGYVMLGALVLFVAYLLFTPATRERS